MAYIERKISDSVLRGARFFPVTVITGPRQSGKSTLCEHLFQDFNKYNLEDIGLRDLINADPKGFINNCGEKVVIDEIQHLPSLFSYIQLAVDANPQRRFILTGSSNFALMEKITQTLAGRSVLFTLLPMSLAELSERYVASPTNELLYNGFYPSVVTDSRPADLYYPSYYSTYVERDVRQIKSITDMTVFQKFIRLAAGRVGCEFNASQLANETGVSSPTISSWMSILEASYIAFTLPPYHTNINKRLTKTPKIYFYDTGLLCFLLGIENSNQLTSHPLRGGVFENLAILEFIKGRLNVAKQKNIYFYRENSGREVDLVQEEGNYLDIYEVKSSQTFNKSFLRNLEYLKGLLDDKVRKMQVIYDGDSIPPLLSNVRDIAKMPKDS